MTPLPLPLLVVERIMPSAQLRSSVTDEEWAESERFGSEQRRAEWLTWHAVVHRVLGRDAKVRYNEVGAPYVEESEICFSVSHSKSLLAVLFSEHRCGVDMERLDRRFDRISSKYLTPEEQRLGCDARFMAAAWSAKEALYKYVGEKGLSLLEDIRIVAYEAGHSITAQIKDGEPLQLSIREYSLDDGIYQAVTID